MQFLTNSFPDNLATGRVSPRRLRRYISRSFKIFTFASLASFAGAALAASEKTTAVTQAEIVEPGGITQLAQTSSATDVQLNFAIRDDAALSLAVPDHIVVRSATQEVLPLSIEKPVPTPAAGSRSLQFAVPLPSTRDTRRGEYSGNMTVLAQYN